MRANPNSNSNSLFSFVLCFARRNHSKFGAKVARENQNESLLASSLLRCAISAQTQRATFDASSKVAGFVCQALFAGCLKESLNWQGTFPPLLARDSNLRINRNKV